MSRVTASTFAATLVAVGCSPTPPNTQPEPTQNTLPATTPVEDSMWAWLKSEDATEYLIGKSLPLTVPSAGQPAGPSLTLTRDNLEAVDAIHQIDSGATAPWGSTPVDLIVRSGQDRYVIRIRILHRLVNGKRVFKEFEVREVVKQ